MKIFNHSSVILLCLLFNIHLCSGIEDPPKRNDYLVKTAIGTLIGGTIVAQSLRLAGYKTNKQGLDALPYGFTLIGICYSAGGCMGSIYSSSNKTKVFIKNVPLTAISMGLLYLIDKNRIIFGLTGAFLVPFFTAINAYHIDCREYEKHTGYTSKHILYDVSRSDDVLREIDFRTNSTDYSVLGQRIFNVKLQFITIEW